MNKVITPEKGFNLRLMPMWDGPKIDGIDFIIQEVNGPCQDIILSVENAIELRNYLNELLK